MYILNLRHDVSSAIATSAFGFCGIFVLWLVFGFKYLSWWCGTRSQVADIRRPHSTSIESQYQMSPTRPISQNLSPDMIRTMTSEEQYAYYTQQIQRYTNLRLELSDNNSTNSQVEVSNHSVAANGNGTGSCSHLQELQTSQDAVYMF